MAKLTAPTNAGFNAGKNYYAKHMRIADIVIDPEISQIFDIRVNVKDEILKSIKESGYDESQPVVVWKGTNILVDGRTRYTASKEAGLEEIPINEKSFITREDAILYSFARQAIRRQLSSVEILKAAEMLPIERNLKGQGRAAEEIARRLGVSPSTIYQANSVLKNAPEEDIQAVKDGSMSLKKAYNKNKPKRDIQDEPSCERKICESTEPDEHITQKYSFLVKAVILLVAEGEQMAVKKLIHHFVDEDELSDFSNLLPETVQKSLAILNSK